MLQCAVKMKFEISAILLLSSLTLGLTKSFDIKRFKEENSNDIDNDIIDFDDEYSVKYDKKYEVLPWRSSDFKKDTYKYTIIKEDKARQKYEDTDTPTTSDTATDNIQRTTELSVIPLELLSTTEGASVSVTEHTSAPDLTVIPLSTTQKVPMEIIFNETVTLPPSTEISEDFNSTTVFYEMTTKTINLTDNIDNTTTTESTTSYKYTIDSDTEDPIITQEDTSESFIIIRNNTDNSNKTFINSSGTNYTIIDEAEEDTSNEEVSVFTELDVENLTDVPEDYYDSKDIVPTPTPKTDTLSVIFGFAGSVVESVVESVAERVVPKGLYDLFKRMQRQNELLEAEKLRSREENGGIGKIFILKKK